MIYRFGEFELDTAKIELRANGSPVAVEPQVFALLRLLVENRDRALTKEEIIEQVWDGRFISDAALSSRIKSARQAVGDDGRAQNFIRTLHGVGFRFVADVSMVERLGGAHVLSNEFSGGGLGVHATFLAAGRCGIAVSPHRCSGPLCRYCRRFTG